MPKTKYLFVFGTRPEAIKMAPVLQALQRDPQAECVVCVTGQHEELLASVLRLFQIKPDYQLRVMSHNQQLCGLTSRLLVELEKVIAKERPDWVRYRAIRHLRWQAPWLDATQRFQWLTSRPEFDLRTNWNRFPKK